jgi:hypothetical protein
MPALHQINFNGILKQGRGYSDMHTKTKSLVGLLALGLALQASASTTTQAISGAQNAQENGCVDAIAIFGNQDCSYGGINRWTANNPSLPGGAGIVFDPDISSWTEEDTPAIVQGTIYDRLDRLWVGPLANHMYYPKGDGPLARSSEPVLPSTFEVRINPEVGDNKAAMTLSGVLTIDDNDTATGDDDLISGSIVISAGSRNVLTGQDANSRVEESWDTLTQTLAPTAVHSATANAAGGFDYVIASRGLPDILQPDGFKNTTEYPSEVASSPADGISGFAATDSQNRGVASQECAPEIPTDIEVTWNSRRNTTRAGSHLGAECADPALQNIGATTTGEFSGYSCYKLPTLVPVSELVPNPIPGAWPPFVRVPVLDENGNLTYEINNPEGTCINNSAMLGAPSGDPGYQNLLIEVSTDAGGHIVSSFAMYAHEYQVLQSLFNFSTPYEGWDGGTLTMAGAVQAGSMQVRPSGGSPDINIKSGGGVAVALFSNEHFDATQATNLAFGPAGVGIVHNAAHVSDIDGDGLDDLTMHFKQKDSGVACGDTSASLTGDTGGGDPFATSAPINVVGCN